MSAFQIKTFADMYTAVQEELKYNAGDTVSRDRIKRDINLIYTSEVVPAAAWPSLRLIAQLNIDAKLTISSTIVQGTPAVTLGSAHATSLVGYAVSFGGSGTIYYVRTHAAGSTALVLETAVTEGSATVNADYWNYRLPLPVGMTDVIQVMADGLEKPLMRVGPMEFRRYFTQRPFDGGLPAICSILGPSEYAPYASVGSLPATLTRSSDGLVKTLVFAASVASLLAVGDRIRVSAAGHFSYNVDAEVVSVSSATITYVGKVLYTEAATADASVSVTRLSTRTSEEEYMELWVTPSFTDQAIALTVDGKRRPKAMEADSEEPFMPIEDRSVLVYGALSRAWARERNPSEAARNYNLYQEKLRHMKGKFSGTTDQPTLRISSTYLEAKRGRTRRNFRNF